MNRTLFYRAQLKTRQRLELQAQIYDKVSRESNQRTISSQASKFVNSNNLQTKQYNSNLSVSITSASPENSGKHRNFALRQNSHQLPKTSRIKLLTQNDFVRNANKNSNVTSPEYQCCSPGDRYTIVSKTNLSNKHHKQSCPSQNRCQVCSGFHHNSS